MFHKNRKNKISHKGKIYIIYHWEFSNVFDERIKIFYERIKNTTSVYEK